MHSDFGAPPPDRGLPLWSFREDVAVESNEDGSVTVLTRWGEVHLDNPPPASVDGLHRMTLGPVALTNVANLDWDDLHDVLLRLPGCVVRSLGLRDSAMALLSIIPVAPRARFELLRVDSDQPIRLSRFAFLRGDDNEMVIESPLAHHRVGLHRPLAAWVASSLGRPTTSAEVARGINVPESLVTEMVAYLAAAGMIVFGDERGGAAVPARFDEDTDPVLCSWTPHDLLFHSHGRLGQHDDPVRAGHGPAGPAEKQLPAGIRFPLPRPNAGSAADHVSLGAAVDQRGSVREFAEEGLSSARLGELLYRSAGVRSMTEADPRYELDLYLTIDRSPDLPRGNFHYDPGRHVLTLVNDKSADADELLDSAMVGIGGRRRPPVLITMTARRGRRSWVYDRGSYATTLRHVGVLQQTLYLVATALGLAPCALALGDDDAAATAYGLDYPAEVSVGEFVVGLPRVRSDRLEQQ